MFEIFLAFVTPNGPSQTVYSDEHVTVASFTLACTLPEVLILGSVTGSFQS